MFIKLAKTEHAINTKKENKRDIVLLIVPKIFESIFFRKKTLNYQNKEKLKLQAMSLQ